MPNPFLAYAQKAYDKTVDRVSKREDEKAQLLNAFRQFEIQNQIQDEMFVKPMADAIQRMTPEQRAYLQSAVQGMNPYDAARRDVAGKNIFADIDWVDELLTPDPNNPDHYRRVQRGMGRTGEDVGTRESFMHSPQLMQANATVAQGRQNQVASILHKWYVTELGHLSQDLSKIRELALDIDPTKQAMAAQKMKILLNSMGLKGEADAISGRLTLEHFNVLSKRVADFAFASAINRAEAELIIAVGAPEARRISNEQRNTLSGYDGTGLEKFVDATTKRINAEMNQQGQQRERQFGEGRSIFPQNWQERTLAVTAFPLYAALLGYDNHVNRPFPNNSFGRKEMEEFHRDFHAGDVTPLGAKDSQPIFKPFVYQPTEDEAALAEILRMRNLGG